MLISKHRPAASSAHPKGQRRYFVERCDNEDFPWAVRDRASVDWDDYPATYRRCETKREAVECAAAMNWDEARR